MKKSIRLRVRLGLSKDRQVEIYGLVLSVEQKIQAISVLTVVLRNQKKAISVQTVVMKIQLELSSVPIVEIN